MVRKIFTTRNNKSTREVDEAEKAANSVANNRRSAHKGTARVSRCSSGTEKRVRGAVRFLSDLPHLQQKAFMSFPTNPSARKANIFYTKCNTHFDKLIPRLNLDDKGRNTLRQKIEVN